MLTVLGLTAFVLWMLPWMLLSGGHVGGGQAGTTPNPTVHMAKSKSTNELTTFTASCGNDTTVCSFKSGTTSTISAECVCASHRIILNAQTLRKIIDGGMSTPLGTLKLITTKNWNNK
jgi:hypothetical protein